MHELEYDPSTKGPLVERYPDLAKYPEFSEGLGDKLLRFCILYYDEASPFFKNRDIEDKKNKCYEAIKADMELKKEVEYMGNQFKLVALRWFKLHHSYTFEEWWSRKVDFHENSMYLTTSLTALLKPEDEARVIQRKEGIKKNLGQDRDALLALENTLFSDEKIKKLITRAANEASLTGYAEKYAKNFFEELEKS